MGCGDLGGVVTTSSGISEIKYTMGNWSWEK